ncbi:ATP-binding cassette domain-containing protein [Desulfurivibrio sp. D14AmB]|uniref:ATP-binding cassette domain-containing protein n=1 Tax=Desulfurivibrio sp. D14AmB TaxID=3374370 RepID=UPI00376F36A6
MALISLQQVTLAFGGRPLLDGVNLQVEAGERLCLLGRNGEGKSTLLRILNQELEVDGGEVIRRKGLRSARLEQEVPPGLHGTVREVAATAIAAGGARETRHLEKVLSRLELPPEQEFAQLSGGLKRRVLLARALANDPELLLLDEPTNHLDLEAINRLENFLLAFTGAVVFITHDRALVRRLATRIIALDRGRITSWPGDYDNYLRRREELLAAESTQAAKFDRKLAQEETWIRQGIKARRTRNQGRVEALLKMRRERAARREQSGRVKMQLQESTTSGRLVTAAKKISFAYDDLPVVRELTTTIMRGDKVGIIGPNGVGKTTLLKLLLGELSPQSGEVRLGTNLEVCYFDQHREQLDPARSVADNLADGHDTVLINGRPRHIMGYLQDFLFTPDRARSPVGILSGGEKNRLLLARLFTRPCNVLVMDEPTNDLDVETLELLEELLLDFSGTLLLVSHDRTFLNNVVTSTLVCEGGGQVTEYAGGYDDWLRQRREPPLPAAPPQTKKSGEPAAKPAGRRKLTFTEAHELAALPAAIEELESRQGELLAAMAADDFYRQPPGRITAHQAELTALEQKLAQTYRRWEELESLA